MCANKLESKWLHFKLFSALISVKHWRSHIFIYIHVFYFIFTIWPVIQPVVKGIEIIQKWKMLSSFSNQFFPILYLSHKIIFKKNGFANCPSQNIFFLSSTEKRKSYMFRYSEEIFHFWVKYSFKALMTHGKYRKCEYALFSKKKKKKKSSHLFSSAGNCTLLTVNTYQKKKKRLINYCNLTAAASTCHQNWFLTKYLKFGTFFFK